MCISGQNLHLSVSAATFSRNEARFGGAVFVRQVGEALLTNSTFEENGWLPSTASTLPDSESYSAGGAMALEAVKNMKVLSHTPA